MTVGLKAAGAISNAADRSPLASISHARTRLLSLASIWARPAAMVVLPTPPFPVTKISERSVSGGVATRRPDYGAPKPTRRSVLGAPTST